MTPYNINVVKPEDEEPIYNALQLQAASGFAFGHHNGSSPYPDAQIVPSGRSGYTYPHISASGFANDPYPSRPQLSHLETSPGHFDEVQRRIAMDNIRYTHGHSSTFQTSPIPHGWSMVDFMDATTASNFVGGSPMSQGHSPLTPNTPLSTVEPSPTVSSLPSPGSQGSNEVLHLAPSPVHNQAAMGTASELDGAFGELQLNNFYSYHHHGSETQLSAPQTYAHPHMQLPVQPQFSDTAHNSSQLAVLTRRHSHSALVRPQLPNSPSSGYSPYPASTSLPARNPVLRNRASTEVPLVPRPEYKFQDWFLPGPVVPQVMYAPHSASDRRRYVEEFRLQPPIYFKRTDGPGIGITLPECVTHRFKQLVGYDDELFEGCGPSISVRLNWRGYEAWTRQIPTRNFKVPPGPITRKNLAKNIAKTVQRFIDEHIDRKMQPGANPSWQVGPGKIEFNDLVLLSIHHVSRGSWQANLCLSQPLEQILNRSLVAQ